MITKKTVIKMLLYLIVAFFNFFSNMLFTKGEHTLDFYT